MSGGGDNNFVKIKEREISVRPTKMTRPVKVEPKWSVPIDVATEISRILG